jgi:hypothetical protein
MRGRDCAWFRKQTRTTSHAANFTH